ncbi:MAG: Rieske (2Fe-2S) protein, partial [Pseudomonadota bacterium]
MVTATAQDTANEALGNGPAWYLVARCDALKRGKQIRRILAGKPVLIGRRSEGDVFAMRDVCPHRLVPLSAGRQVETEGETTVECPYHG